MKLFSAHSQITPFVITNPKELSSYVTMKTWGERECGVYSVLMTWKVHKARSIWISHGLLF